MGNMCTMRLRALAAFGIYRVRESTVSPTLCVIRQVPEQDQSVPCIRTQDMGDGVQDTTAKPSRATLALILTPPMHSAPRTVNGGIPNTEYLSALHLRAYIFLRKKLLGVTIADIVSLTKYLPGARLIRYSSSSNVFLRFVFLETTISKGLMVVLMPNTLHKDLGSS